MRLATQTLASAGARHPWWTIGAWTAVLLPSAMKLLGEMNWYLPRWLQWIPRLDAEGSSAAPRSLEPTKA